MQAKLSDLQFNEVGLTYKPNPFKPVVANQSALVYELAIELFDKDTFHTQERMVVLFVNNKNYVHGYSIHTVGTVAGVIVDPRVIIKSALDYNATGIILVHNHPSGDCKPSNPDKKMTRRLQECCKLMGLTLLDHLIISHESYFSFADELIL